MRHHALQRALRWMPPAAIALGSALAATPTAGPGPGSPAADRQAVDTCGRAKAAAGREARARLQIGDDPSFGLTDVQHYRLELDVYPGARTVSGRCVIRVASMVDDLETFRVWLHPSLAIRAVEVDARVAGSRRQASGAVDIDLGRAYDAGEVFDVAVSYAGAPTMRDFFGTQGGSPLVFTFSQPWHAFEWWPVKDDIKDKASGDLLISVPSELTVVSNGVLVDVADAGFDRRRFHWSTAYPTSPHLFAFAATAYTVFSRELDLDGRTMPVEFYIYPDSDSEEHRAGWLKVVDMLDTFSDLFGRYPFVDEKYAIYQFGWGGGMEHQTATGQGESAAFMENLTAHELAHQWWGDMVTCADWHHIWLNEGFATYATGLWYEHASGVPDAAALAEYMQWARPAEVDGNVYVEDATDRTEIFSPTYSYRKGAWVVHMLRGVVGTETFFAILDAYRQRHAYGTATTEDFQAVAEEVWGGDLGWFFDRWIYGGGAPGYRFGWRRHRAGGQRYLAISLEQTQDEAVFDMPVTVEAEVGGERLRWRVWSDARSEHFLLPVPAPVEDVHLDPGGWILTREVTRGPFVNGPPRIVRVEPEPGSRVPPGEVLDVSVTFHEDVVIREGDVVLSRTGGAPVAADIVYDSRTFTATLTTRRPLSTGRYRLVVGDGIVDAVGGLALDGEVEEGRVSPQMPSGDGVPGGAAVLSFGVVRQLRPSGRLRPTR